MSSNDVKVNMDADDGKGALVQPNADLEAKVNRLMWCVGIQALLIVLAVGLGIGALANVDSHGHEDQHVVDFSDSATMDGYDTSALYRGSGYWATKQMDQKLSDFVAVADGDYIYMIGGLDEEGSIRNNTLRYDTLLQSFTEMAPMPSARFRFGAALLDGSIVVVGGFDSHDGQPVECAVQYSVAADEWTEAGCTALPHGDTCAAALGGKVYVVAGYGTDYEMLSAVEAYDPAANAWAAVEDLPEPRGDIACAAAGDAIYAVGGYYDPSGAWEKDSFHASTYKFDGAAWTRVADMTTARGDKGLVALDDGHLLVVGGETHARNEVTQIPHHSVELYSAAHDVWIEKAPVAAARFRLGAAAVNGMAYALGGHQLCSTGWNDDWDDPSCSESALDTAEVFFELSHPDVFVHSLRDSKRR